MCASVPRETWKEQTVVYTIVDRTTVTISIVFYTTITYTNV